MNGDDDPGSYRGSGWSQSWKSPLQDSWRLSPRLVSVLDSPLAGKPQSGINQKNPAQRRKLAWTWGWNWQGPTVTRGCYGLREEAEGSRGGAPGEQEGWVTSQSRTRRRGLRPAANSPELRAPPPHSLHRRKAPTAGAEMLWDRWGKGSSRAGKLGDLFAGRFVEGKLRTSWGWWQLQEKDCLNSALCWRIFSAFTLHPELNASQTAESPQCLRQVRPGSGRKKIRNQERKKTIFLKNKNSD